MKKDIVAFYPYSPAGIGYQYTVQKMISSCYQVISWEKLDEEWVDYNRIRCIYLNWLENRTDLGDLGIIKKAKGYGARIIWVFHNRLPHNYDTNADAYNNVKMIAEMSDIIIIHSHKSVDYLSEYIDVKTKRIEYIPHPNFIGDYVALGNNNRVVNKKEFVFALYGTLRNDKNIEIIIDSFNSLPSEWNCKLMIIGRGTDKYYDFLQKITNKNDSIIIKNVYIPSINMCEMLDYADVLVLPYDVNSCMNSGAMIMAFSYKKSVITSNIAMADDFSADDIYKYEYTDENEHVYRLAEAMKKAYLDGKEKLHEKGERLYECVRNNNSKEYVKRRLLEII